jgi:hypothetical protein
MNAWQPIKSAPTDGRPVLLRGGKMTASAPLSKDNIASGQYASSDNFPCVVAVSRPVSEYRPGEFVWRYCNYQGGYYGYYEDPTEWMPIP